MHFFNLANNNAILAHSQCETKVHFHFIRALYGALTKFNSLLLFLWRMPQNVILDLYQKKVQERTFSHISIPEIADLTIIRMRAPPSLFLHASVLHSDRRFAPKCNRVQYEIL